jgi:hypothetical protein
MNTAALLILTVLTPLIFFVPYGKEGLLRLIPASESIPVSESIRVSETIPVPKSIPAFRPIPPSEKNPVRTATTTDETESAPTWAFQGRDLPEDEKYLWNILLVLIPTVICIFFYLMDCRPTRGRHRDDKTKEERSHLRMLEDDDISMPDLRGMVAFMKKMEDKLRAELQNRTESTMVKDKRRAQLYNEVSSMNISTMKVKEKSYIRFQDTVDIIPVTITNTYLLCLSVCFYFGISSPSLGEKIEIMLYSKS